MAQGQLTKEQVQRILDDPEHSDLIDEKTKGLLRFTVKMTKESYKIVTEDIQGLRQLGYSDDDILEAMHVIAFFNYLDRMADATGAPMENLQEIIANTA